MKTLIGIALLLLMAGAVVHSRRKRLSVPAAQDANTLVVAPPLGEEEGYEFRSDSVAADILSRHDLFDTVLPPPSERPMDAQDYLDEVSVPAEKPSLRYKPFKRLRHNGE
jgi:hypothetical protein